MKKFNQVLIITIITLFLLNSCASSKDIQYFQNVEDGVLKDSTLAFGAKIQSGDLLFINVSTINAEAAVPFNLYDTPMLQNSGNGAKPITYLVDDDGNINFPVLGRVEVAGLTTNELIEKLESDLVEYITNPTINIRFANFRVSVLGEVTRPGSYQVLNERISVIEAIGLAGDLTIYGQRDNVLLVRIENGEKVFVTLDLTNSEIFDSPYYNLKQNDIIYISPNKTRVNASAVGPNTGIIISSASLLITVLALIIK
ncbi:polysaccharide biosynthesis/export family protein [Algibacter lectus]|uniref:polysaccharide biosynthesis/export family protein n=1 Tax=Algibacter lectus TaxID=221126 RepID=UPI0026E995F4|nr:polysaccharide biosynthesis/export family protein [Algibacter lectus]MDO7138858.1 polysaccharide biosynthesis/export family protein [Algibacter lectus]